MTKRRANGEGSIYPYEHGFRGYAWVTTPAGRRVRKYVTAPTREGVREKLDKVRDAAARGPIHTRVPTVAQYLDGWLEEVVRPSLAPSTASNYELFSRLYIVPTLGQRLDRLTVRDAQNWLNSLRTTCQCCAQGKDDARAEPRCCATGKCCQQIAKPWTIRQAWQVLRAALSQAQRDEYVPRNVAALVRVPIPRPQQRPTWTVPQAKQFLVSAQADADPLQAAYVLALVLALRRGEILGLPWSCVDLENGSIRVAWQLQRVKGQLLHRRTKTVSSDAVLPLPGLVADALRAHRAAQNARRLAAGPAWHDTGLVVTTRYGLPLDPRNFHRMFKERAAKAGVPVIPVHSTRHTCASLLVDLDVHPRIAMAILRHSQIAVTMQVYSQVAAPGMKEALDRLGDQLS